MKCKESYGIEPSIPVILFLAEVIRVQHTHKKEAVS